MVPDWIEVYIEPFSYTVTEDQARAMGLSDEEIEAAKAKRAEALNPA